MAYEKIAEGGVWSLWDIPGYEDRLAEGDKGELRFHLRTPLPDSTVNWIKSELASRGVPLWGGGAYQATSSPDILYIRWVKGGYWIPVIIAVVAVLILVILSKWELLKISPAGITFSWPLIILLVLGVIVLLYVVPKARGM